MGWSGKDIIWGDEPQDIVDDATVKKLGKDFWKNLDGVPYRKRMQTATILSKDKKLRKKVDKSYLDTWDRKATNAEFENLLRVGLFLKGGILG